MNKNIPIYVYYITIERQKNANEQASKYDMNEIVSAFSNLICYISKKDLKERSVKNTALDKVIWLDSYSDLKNGNFDIVFKSAKYNHVRTEIDTENMTPLGHRKRPQDGEEEKTHLCIRLVDGNLKFLAIHESNHYGISIKSIIDYINTQFDKYNEESESKYYYQAFYDIVPNESFLGQLKQAKKYTALTLEVDKSLLNDDFWKLSGRNDVKDYVKVILNRPRGIKNFPENLIKAYYQNMQTDNRIRSITVNGRGKLDNDLNMSTDLIKIKQYVSVECEEVTNEVKSSDFFIEAQKYINEKAK